MSETPADWTQADWTQADWTQADWTKGVEVIRYQACTACGANELADKRASGEGIVYATSLVARAATPETRAHVPYNIVLVDTAEGFRMMAHGDRDLAIGDRVNARFAPFAGRLVPYFGRLKF